MYLAFQKVEKTESQNGFADRDYVRIGILDSGLGIPNDILSDVVEPFFTTVDYPFEELSAF